MWLSLGKENKNKGVSQATPRAQASERTQTYREKKIDVQGEDLNTKIFKPLCDSVDEFNLLVE